MTFVTGFLLVLAGIAILRYRYQIYNFTGDWDWAVRFLGGNGTVVSIALFGMLLIGAGAAYPFGVFDARNHPINEIKLFPDQKSSTTK